MPQGTHVMDLNVPIQDVWEFVSDMNNWAPLVPGYMNHEIISERESTWTFRGDIGIMKKKISLKIDITERREPTKVTFDLTGLNENFSGDGYFEAQAMDENRTRMTGMLDITAKGAVGHMINAVLNSYVPKTAEELATAIGYTIEKLYIKN